MKISESEFASFGKLLVKIQFFEVILKMYISLLNSDIKKRNPSIKNLNGRDILDDSIAGKKHTLGMLMLVIKKEMPFFDNNEFSRLLDMRNTFAHNFHKEYLSVDKVSESNYMEFINELWGLTDKYTEIFTGLMEMANRKANGESSDLSVLKGLGKSELSVIQYFIDQ